MQYCPSILDGPPVYDCGVACAGPLADLALISRNRVAKNNAAKIAVNAPKRNSIVVSVVDVVLVKVAVVVIGGGVCVSVAKLVCVTVA
jgi:hypothetical protein